MSSGGFDATGQPHRVVPDGCMDFIFDLDDPRGAIVVGAMQRAKVVQLRAGARVFGVRFRPGAGALYVDAPARELRDRVCPAGRGDPLATVALGGPGARQPQR